MRNDQPYNILFLCTGNSARSILAEGLVNLLGKGRFHAYSAGSQPTGRVNPFVIELLAQMGCDVSGVRSKSWDAFTQPGAPHMHFIITVCDNAANTACPVWPGHPAVAHWGFADPAAIEGSDEAKRAAFQRIFGEIRQRVQLLLGLPIAELDHLTMLQKLREIGASPGHPKPAR